MATVTLSCTLTQTSSGAAVPNEPIQFYTGTSATTLTALGSPVDTNASGVATTTVPNQTPASTIYAQAKFAGDTTNGYNASASAVESAVVTANTTITLTLASA
jgi:hypothetical protein